VRDGQHGVVGGFEAAVANVAVGVAHLLGRDSLKLFNVAEWQLLNQLGSKILL
jgi:hypothetical protein